MTKLFHKQILRISPSMRHSPSDIIVMSEMHRHWYSWDGISKDLESRSFKMNLIVNIGNFQSAMRISRYQR